MLKHKTLAKKTFNPFWIHFHIYPFPAAYINSLNTLFEPNQHPPQSVHQPVFIPEPIYDFQSNSYPNLYAVSEPYLSPYAFYNVHNETTDNKSHKWWSFHNLKEKFKSLFKFKNQQNNEVHNSGNLLYNQQQLQGKKFQIKI